MSGSKRRVNMRPAKGLTPSVGSLAPARLRAMCWLSDSSLLVVGSGAASFGPTAAVRIRHAASHAELRVRWLALPSTTQANVETQGCWIAVAQADVPLRPGSDLGVALLSDGS